MRAPFGRRHPSRLPCVLLAAGWAAAAAPLQAQRTPAFDVVEASIADIHRAMAAGELSAEALVRAYLARIEAYDKRGPYLNSIIVVNPGALERARELDAEYRRTGRFTGPLHGIPVIVKDNFDTHDLPTTAGSLALEGSVPPDDAFQVRRIRDAGAIVLAKSNLAEFAFTAAETVGSMLPGYTRNPYDPKYGTAGSSGGTAAAVAASLGAVGLGSDTGNSIRGPSSHTALVGIRSTMGLTSRDGVVPLFLDKDIGGPMARTVADAVAVFDVIAGSDPADPVTAEADARRPSSYMDHLKEDGLRGARIGVVRALSNTGTSDPEVVARFDEALGALERAGATLVDPAEIPGWEEIRRRPFWCSRFRKDIEDYLATLGPEAPVKTLQEILRSRRFHPSVETRIRNYLDNADAPDTDQCRAAAETGERLRAALRELMARERLDALVYPTWSNAPRLIGDLNTPDGNNSWQLSPPTGFPAITVPMGYVAGGLPVGLQLLGDSWSDARLIELAYAFEQATRHRRPPPTTPALGN